MGGVFGVLGFLWVFLFVIGVFCAGVFGGLGFVVGGFVCMMGFVCVMGFFCGGFFW